MRGRRRGPDRRDRLHPVRVDVVRRPAGRRLCTNGAPNAAARSAADAQAYTDSYAAADARAQRAPDAPTDVDADAAADARAQQAPDTATDARTLAEAYTAAHTYADAVAVAAPKPTALAASDAGAR